MTREVPGQDLEGDFLKENEDQKKEKENEDVLHVSECYRMGKQGWTKHSSWIFRSTKF